MITKWKVSNFKSIRLETELDLGSLTIFAGANSSGKSTLIQSILIVAQTLAHKVGSRSIVLNGALTSLGQFDDLKSNAGVSERITIKCTCRPHLHLPVVNHGSRSNQLEQVDCEFSFDADVSSPQRDFFQLQPRIFASQLSLVFRDEDNVDQTSNLSIYRSDKTIPEIAGVDRFSEVDDKIRASLDFAVELDENSEEEMRDEFRSVKPVGCMFRHFLPERIVCAVDIIEENAFALTNALQGGIQPFRFSRWFGIGGDSILSEEIIVALRKVLEGTAALNFFGEYGRKVPLFSSDAAKLTMVLWIQAWQNNFRNLTIDDRWKIHQVLNDREDLFDVVHEAMKASFSEGHEQRKLIELSPPRLIRNAASYFDNFFATSLKYLGPLRDAPKPLYPLAPATYDPRDVGLRGEHTASILELHKNKKIAFIPSASFKNPEIDRKLVTRTLEAAVVDWLQYLEVAYSVNSHDRGKLGYELKVGHLQSDRPHDLTHVGVGVSQVLPILVMCLLADTDSTLVFEQPELHLHPKVQTLLGDFFLSMALCNKQCIVETHSEYLISRLRFRIAAASPERELGSKTKIYFVEQSARGSTFREVAINEFGAVLDWPEGFFDQSHQQAEEILIAAAKKRKASRRNRDE